MEKIQVFKIVAKKRVRQKLSVIVKNRFMRTNYLTSTTARVIM